MAFRLPRLPRNVTIADPATGYPTQAFQRWWQSVVETLEAQETAQDAAIIAIQNAQAAADAANAAAAAADAAAATAQTAADTAQTAADNAQTAADDAATVAALTASGVTGLTLTATDAGANATITVSAHTRVYGDGTSVSVNGGSVTALAYSTIRHRGRVVLSPMPRPPANRQRHRPATGTLSGRSPRQRLRQRTPTAILSHRRASGISTFDPPGHA